MPIRFTPSRRAGTTPLTRTLGRATQIGNANDNRDPNAPVIDALLESALRHFGEHGLAAARVARENAETARNEKRQDDYEHWQDICRIFDRPMADQLERKESA